MITFSEGLQRFYKQTSFFPPRLREGTWTWQHSRAIRRSPTLLSRRRSLVGQLKDSPHLFVGEFEVEHVEIALQVIFASCLRDGSNVLLLNQPPQSHLRRALAMSFSDLSQRRIVQDLPPRDGLVGG